MNRLFLFLLICFGFQQKSVGATVDDWQPVSEKQALAFVEDFYTHAPADGNVWNETVLEQYLAPSVLRVLQTEAANSSDGKDKYASWWLTCTDNTGMILPSSNKEAALITDDGRVSKTFKVYYWADTWLRSEQTLYFTVKSKNGRLLITQIDGMSDEAANSVWEQLEIRNEGREQLNEHPSKYEGKIGSYGITLFMKTENTEKGDEVGHYYYNNAPQSVFTLKQTTFDAVNASGTMRLVLKEYTKDGHHTGTFDGFLEMRGGSYHGTFTNSKGKKYKFDLMEQTD